MKIRNGFVSNSSSTSHVIILHVGVPKPLKPRRVDKYIQDFFKRLKEACNGDTELNAQGVQDVLSFIYSKECWWDESKKERIVEAIQKMDINNDRVVYCYISYHDDELRKILDKIPHTEIFQGD